MKALVYLGPNQMEYKDVADVTPKADEVKVDVKSCGICGSDVHGYLGLTGRRTEPMAMGHEFSGQVSEVGGGVKSFKPGDRVAVYPVDFCGECDMCGQGQYQLCKDKRQFGVLEVDGAFADSICVPEKCCFPLKEDVSFDIASLVEPFAVALHGVRHAGDVAGKNVLVEGAGTIGLLALSSLKLLGAGKVIVSDINETRLGVAKAMGADETVNPTVGDFEQNIAGMTGGKGADIAIEAVGSAITVQQASKALRFGGTAIWLGNNKPMIEMNMQEVVTREQKVYGSFLYTLDDFRQVIEWINAGKANVDALVSKTAPMSEGVFYFEKLAHDPEDLIKVVLTNE